MTMPSRRLHAAAAVRAGGEERLHLLLDGTDDFAIFMLGPQGMVLTWNAAAEHMTGYSAEEIIGQPSIVFYPPEAVTAGQPERCMKEAVARGRHEDEGWRVRKDGTQFWAHIVVTPLRDRDGRLRGFGVVTRDLTDRMRAEDMLAVIDAAEDGIFGVDRHGVIILANRVASAMFGYEDGALVGRPIEVLLPAGIRRRHERHREWYEANPEPRPMGTRDSFTAVRKDGTELQVEVQLSFVNVPRGRVIRAVVRDVSEQRTKQAVRATRLAVRRAAERQAAERAEERMQAFLDESPVGQFELGSDGVLTRVNASLHRMLAYPPGELIGEHVGRVLPSGDAAVIGHALGGRGDPGQFSRSRHQRLVGKDGRVVPVTVLSTITRDAEGCVARVNGVVLDSSLRDQVLLTEDVAGLAAAPLIAAQARSASAGAKGHGRASRTSQARSPGSGEPGMGTHPAAPSR